MYILYVKVMINSLSYMNAASVAKNITACISPHSKYSAVAKQHGQIEIAHTRCIQVGHSVIFIFDKI